MARTVPGAPSDASAASSPSIASPSRVAKPRSERSGSGTMRQRGKMLATTSRSAVFKSMIEDAQEGLDGASDNNTSLATGKGKSRAVPLADDFSMDSAGNQLGASEGSNIYSIMDKEDKPFPIMELPTEIRLEIYRACLTRPYQILLSKRDSPTVETNADTEKGSLAGILSDADETDDDVPLRARSSRQHRNTAMNMGSTRRAHIAGGLRGVSSRVSRPVRFLSSHSAHISGHNHHNLAHQSIHSAHQSHLSTAGNVYRIANPRSTRRNGHNGRNLVHVVYEPPRNQMQDPFLVNILQASKEIYKEARSVLYSENFFTLDLNTAISTLYCLHQRSRRQIKHVELEIPTYNEILERFQETVRLSLRYCSGLKRLVIHMPFTLPGADGSGTTGNTTVYANGFDILRWLPQECDVILKGNVCVEIEMVVNKHLHLAKTLDKFAYARRQLISNDTGVTSVPALATGTLN